MSDNTQNKPTKEDIEKVDEYHGKYKANHEGKSVEELFGTDQNPVQDDKLPASGLKKVGG